MDLSVTNIRRVSKCELLLHKEYFFSFKPILHIHEVVADIVDLSLKKKEKLIKEDELIKLDSVIKEFKEIYSEEGRVVGNLERKVYKALMEE